MYSESPPTCFDSHCHLTMDAFDSDREAVIERARAAGVERIVIASEHLQSSRDALDSARQRPGLYAMAGVHPHHAGEWSNELREELRELCRSESASADDGSPLVALGETGLDFHYDNAPRERQFEAFLAQVEIAREAHLPLVIHCRDAYPEMIQLAREHDIGSVGGVVHCFSGTPEEAVALADMGFFLGIAGPLTFKKNERGREAAKATPVEALVVETDAPYLAPEPKRGKRNEPAFVAYTAERLAEVLGWSRKELSRQLFLNTLRLFGIHEPEDNL